MSVTNESNKVNYSATGLTTYAIPFFFTDNSHVKLYVNDVLKTISTHYTVTGANVELGGTLTLVMTPPVSGSVTIVREIPLKQENTFNEGGQMPAKTIERMFDKLTHLIQQITEKVGRSIKMPISSSTLDPQITGSVVPGALIQVNAGATGFEMGISVDAYDAQLTAIKDLALDAQTASEVAQAAAELAASNASTAVVDDLALLIADAEAAALASEAAKVLSIAAKDAAEAAKVAALASEAAAAISAAAAEAVFSSKTTTNLPEGTNLYYTTARAKGDAVLNVTSGSQTDQAPSVSAMKTYVTANAGGAGGSLSWEKIGDLAPEDNSQDGIKLEAFDRLEEQEIYLTLNVPDNYVAGNPIKLKNGAFFIDVITNKVLFRTLTALIRPGTTVLGTYSNTHASTNSEVTAAGVANTLTAIGDLQLSDASGLINGVAVAANDKLRVKLSRKVASESVSAASKAKLMINNFDVTFK